AKTKVKVSKVDVADGKEIEGATIQILDKDGNVVEEWTSTKEAHEIEGLTTGVEYTLKEKVAPDGYTIASETTFTIDETGKVTSTGTITEDGMLLVESAKTKVVVSFVDKSGKALEGARLQILAKSGKVVEEWTSGKDAHMIEGLNPGEYELKDTSSPKGYNTAASISFTLEADGTVKVNGKTAEKITMTVDKAPASIDTTPKSDTASAKTGDTNTVLPFAVMMALSAATIVYVTAKRKKEKEAASEDK
ncbi:MAG: LPXTG cell wall anchor domain-containing protein, partial [Lachnospiraceae bacterium]|nr:LPXTG cell wall anchor domain-containing protein [Lachnospiraceae bacterium]